MRWLFPVALLAVAIAAKADEPESNSHHIEKSQNGRFLAEFTPASDFGEKGEGRVRAATLFPSSDIYQVHWFANRVKISNDGHFLVRFGPWATDLSGHSDLAIAFYKDGTLLKSYRVKDLVHDPSSVDESVSHYIWEATESNAVAGFSANDTRFTVVTTDKNAYEFDVTTDKILSTHQDPTAKTELEIHRLDEAKAETLARGYIERTPKLQAFSQFFSFSQLSAKSGIMAGVTLKGDEWFGDMHPLNHQLSRTMAEVVFTIDPKSDQVEVGIDPKELEQDLIDLGAVPFVRKLLARRPENGYRIRAARNHYHWDSDEVTRIINAFPSNGPKLPSIDSWIYFIVDTKEGYISIYHPKGSNLFVVTSDPSWFLFSPSELTRLKPIPGFKGDQLPVVDSEGVLQSVVSVPYGNLF